LCRRVFVAELFSTARVFSEPNTPTHIYSHDNSTIRRWPGRRGCSLPCRNRERAARTGRHVGADSCPLDIPVAFEVRLADGGSFFRRCRFPKPVADLFQTPVKKFLQRDGNGDSCDWPFSPSFFTVKMTFERAVRMRIIPHGECGKRWDKQGLDDRNADRRALVAFVGIHERYACFMRRML
jgi:hypothetical protein